MVDIFTPALELAHRSSLQGRVLAEIGDQDVCLIATDEYLYAGKRANGFGKLPLHLYPLPWKSVVQVRLKSGWLSSAVTVQLARPIDNLVQKIVQEGLICRYPRCGKCCP